MLIGATTDALLNCGEIDWKGNAKVCGLSCILSMLPIPDPCGKFGKVFGMAIGVAGGLINSFTPDTLVHVKPAKASNEDAQAARAELKPIGELNPGDEVLAWAEWKDAGNDPKADQRLSYEKVTDVVTSLREQKLIHVELDNGETLTATAGHPFRTLEGWRDAILLKKGGKLLLKGSGEKEPDARPATSAEGATAQAGAREERRESAATSELTVETSARTAETSERTVEIVSVRLETRTTPVFNLEVANAHTFFVGEEGVLVHNAAKNPDPLAPSGNAGHSSGARPSTAGKHESGE